MAIMSPLDKQAKCLSLISSTALGLDKSRKSLESGWNLLNVATGRVADSTFEEIIHLKI